MKVLVIDDEEDVRYIARLSLGRVEGITLLEAESGMEGVALARAEKPDCIVLDVMMPDMEGEATLAALRADPATAAIPVVFLTAVVMAEDYRRLVNLGARGVIRKPFDPRKLVGTLQEILAS